MLLFDQNLSPYIVRRLQDLYPNCIHVRDVELDSADDRDIWDYAKEHDLSIVSKDSDFTDLSSTLGHPPKIILLRLGNVTTAEVESLLRNHYGDISEFCQDNRRSLIVLP